MNKQSIWRRLSNSKIKNPFIPDEVWMWDNGIYRILIQIHHLGDRRFGKMSHIIIKKVNMIDTVKNWGVFINSEEPTYEEKTKIVNKVINDCGNKIAMEVFPAQKNVIDAANLYHVWVADKEEFPFNINISYNFSENNQWEYECVNGLEIEYMIKVIKTRFGKIAYLYLRRCDGKELIWREKQLLKNELQYEDVIAVEIISKFGVGKSTCLICLPLDYYLDFGLHISKI